GAKSRRSGPLTTSRGPASTSGRVPWRRVWRRPSRCQRQRPRWCARSVHGFAPWFRESTHPLFLQKAVNRESFLDQGSCGVIQGHALILRIGGQRLGGRRPQRHDYLREFLAHLGSFDQFVHRSWLLLALLPELCLLGTAWCSASAARGTMASGGYRLRTGATPCGVRAWKRDFVRCSGGDH